VLFSTSSPNSQLTCPKPFFSRLTTKPSTTKRLICICFLRRGNTLIRASKVRTLIKSSFRNPGGLPIFISEKEMLNQGKNDTPRSGPRENDLPVASLICLSISGTYFCTFIKIGIRITVTIRRIKNIPIGTIPYLTNRLILQPHNIAPLYCLNRKRIIPHQNAPLHHKIFASLTEPVLEPDKTWHFHHTPLFTLENAEEITNI